MDIRPPRKPNISGPASQSSRAGVITLVSNGQPVHINPGQIDEVAKKFAKLSKKMGQTDNEEEFAEEMSGNIREALSEVQARQKKKPSF